MLLLPTEDIRTFHWVIINKLFEILSTISLCFELDSAIHLDKLLEDYLSELLVLRCTGDCLHGL